MTREGVRKPPPASRRAVAGSLDLVSRQPRTPVRNPQDEASEGLHNARHRQSSEGAARVAGPSIGRSIAQTLSDVKMAAAESAAAEWDGGCIANALRSTVEIARGAVQTKQTELS